ncbi:MAG: biotin-dependent carboxyltransferase family protein [Oscillospiraceae bacterium]|nr:biotin-dependent carboxyltransferase family protein [Oscillospiraceae bacterium]
MGIRVLKPGLLTTIQDLGRTGYQSQGFGVSGVMDTRSFRIANLLLDNPENEAVIEFTLSGPVLEFTSETIIAITGGDFQPMVNKKPIKMYTAVYMNKGDILEFAGCKTGCRGYIAFSSYLNVPMIMGSRSTNIKCGIGGFKGRKLQERDSIIFRQKRRYLPYFLSRTLNLPDFHEIDKREITLRVVLGPQQHHFSKQGVETFLSGVYTVTSEFDRMGCRLEGPLIESRNSKTGTDIISDGIAFGSVQVPSGKPIILLADRQTTGGYAKIATVASVDIPKLAQRKPGNTVRFTDVTVEEAAKLIKDEMNELEDFRKEIHKPCAEVLDSRLVAKRLQKLFVKAGE